MKKFWQISKFSILTIYLITAFYFIIRSEHFSVVLKVKEWLIITIFTFTIFLIWFRVLKNFFKIKQIENEFISIVNHTFRTPLTSISWSIKEMEKDIPNDQKKFYIQNITNSTNRILEIVDTIVGIRDIKNISSYDFKATSIRDIVEKSILKYKREISRKNLILKISPFKNMPMLTIDLRKISFVIDTIIENAIFYSKEDGKIIIDSNVDSDKITLFVNDNGIGLSMMNKIMLFSKFYRSKRAKLLNTNGMGLRLYLSKEIIKRHKGKIYAKSNGKDRGATFFVEIPIKNK